jgi:hypothetical protein
VLAQRQLLPVIVALIHDNSMQAMGQFVGERQLLEGLAEVRYWAARRADPLLVLFLGRHGGGRSVLRCSCSGRAPSVLGVRCVLSVRRGAVTARVGTVGPLLTVVPAAGQAVLAATRRDVRGVSWVTLATVFTADLARRDRSA